MISIHNPQQKSVIISQAFIIVKCARIMIIKTIESQPERRRQLIPLMSLYSLVVLRVRIRPYNRVATRGTLEKIRSRENFTPGAESIRTRKKLAHVFTGGWFRVCAVENLDTMMKNDYEREKQNDSNEAVNRRNTIID